MARATASGNVERSADDRWRAPPELWDLWEALADVFGDQFTRRFGEEPSPGWHLALCDVPREKLRRGLDELRKGAWRFPPNATEFRELCLRTVPQAHLPFPPALPESDDARTRREAAGREHIAKMKAILRSRSEDDTA